MTSVPAPKGARGALAGRLRDIEAVTDAALSRLDEQALLQALVERVRSVLHADTAAVLLLDRAARQLVATAASGIEEEVRQGVRIPLGAGFAGRVAASGEPVILDHVDRTTVRNPLLVDRGIRSLLGVPLLSGGRVIGVLHVGSLTGRPFGQQDTELLQLAASRAAAALASLMSSWAGCAARCAPTPWTPPTRPRPCACWTARSSTSSPTRWPPSAQRPASGPLLTGDQRWLRQVHHPGCLSPWRGRWSDLETAVDRWRRMPGFTRLVTGRASRSSRRRAPAWRDAGRRSFCRC